MPIANGAPQETLLTIVPNKSNVIFNIDTFYNLDNTVHLVLVVENTDMTTFPLDGLHSIELTNSAVLYEPNTVYKWTFGTLYLNNPANGKYTCNYNASLKKLIIHYELLYNSSPYFSTLVGYEMYDVILNFKNENYLRKLPTLMTSGYITLTVEQDSTIAGSNWACIDRNTLPVDSYEFLKTDYQYGEYVTSYNLFGDVYLAGAMLFPYLGHDLLLILIDTGSSTPLNDTKIISVIVNEVEYFSDEIFYIIPNSALDTVVCYVWKNKQEVNLLENVSLTLNVPYIPVATPS